MKCLLATAQRTARWAGVLALITSVLLWATSCAAQESQSRKYPEGCNSIVEMAKQLDADYGEVPVAIGVQTDGRLLEIYASEASGTWTVIVIRPNGTGCMVAAGRGWEILPIGDRT